MTIRIRQVKNIGFDLVLPGHENASAEPLQPVKSGRSRKTPQPELLPQRSTRRTPKPEKPQLQRSLGKTLATGVTKKRGRPAKKAIPDGFEDLSRSRVTQADEEGITTKKRNTGKVQEEQVDTSQSNAPDVHSGGLGTTEATLSAVPSTGVKKRKKRKSIGQQSTSRSKAAKARSPLKPDRQPRKTKPKPALAEAAEVTDLNKTLVSKEQKEPFDDAVPLDGGEPMKLPEVANVLQSGAERVEPSAEKLQQGIAQKPKKRKRVPVEDLPVKRAKTTSSQSRRVPKISKTQKEVHAEDGFDALQGIEKSAEVEAGSPRNVHEEQETASEIVQLHKEKPKKRKRVTVGQQSKKRVKAGVAQIRGEQKAHKEPRTVEEVSESAQSVSKPAEVEVGSEAHAGEEQEVTAGESELQAQKQKPKRKKRKSIGQQKPKRKSMDLATPKRTDRKIAAGSPVATRHDLNSKPSTKRGRPKAKRTLEEAIEEPHAESPVRLPEEEEAHSSEHGLESKPKARRGRPKTKPIPKDAINLPTEKTNEQAPEDQEEIQPPTLPEKKKRGRPRKTDTSQPTSQTTRPTKIPTSRKSKPKPTPTAPKGRAPPKNTIPITLYAPPSPTSDAEEDPLTTSHPHPPPTTINPVDVLSQVSSELLSKHSAALAEQIRSDPSSTNKSTLKRTKETTDLYARELASHLLQLTTTLNANTSLQSRVRAAAKEERGLKKELKQLQKEREDIKGRKEEVMKERKKRELEDLLSGIAGAVKRGWDRQKEGEGGDAVAGMVEEEDVEV